MKNRSLVEIAKSFKDKQILVVGDAMLDEYIYGSIKRISPEAPVPVVEAQERYHVPGGAANVAATIASLGGKSLLGAVAGKDPQATILKNEIINRGVEVSGLITDEDRSTTTKTRVVSQNQQIVRLDWENRHPLGQEHESSLIEWVESNIKNASACILSDYGKGVLSHRISTMVIRLARESGVTVLVDPKGRSYDKYHGANIITPNIHEVELVLNHDINNEDDLRRACQELFKIVDGEAVLITRGPEGMSLFLRDNAEQHIPAIKRTVYDVTGAGDTVISVLALALASGAAYGQAAFLANLAASIVVEIFGTYSIEEDELLRAIEHSGY